MRDLVRGLETQVVVRVAIAVVLAVLAVDFLRELAAFLLDIARPPRSPELPPGFGEYYRYSFEWRGGVILYADLLRSALSLGLALAAVALLARRGRGWLTARA